MNWHGEPPVDLTPVRSDAIRWVIGCAVKRGNSVISLAEWTKALVTHMAERLDESLKAEIAARWPNLDYYSEAGTPHIEPDEGYTEDGFAVSFPRPRPTQRTE